MHPAPPLVLLLAAAAVSAFLAGGPHWRAFPEARNFEGLSVRVAGLGLVAGLVVALGAAWAMGPYPAGPGPVASLITALGFGGVGALDDRWGNRAASGFRGHLRAALRGTLTTGFWKIVGGGAAALAAAVFLREPERPVSAVVMAAAVIALSANAANLMDTRPVRATAGFLLAALGLWAWGGGTLALAAATGAAVASLPWDRRRRIMLGDSGSNTLGAMAGLCFAASASTPGLAAALLLLLAFHAYTEGHSLNATLARIPALNAVDLWLRGPTPAARATKGGS